MNALPMADPRDFITELLGGACHATHCFETASNLPPITAESLTELDMDRITTNAQFRHDCNFDREIQFRPNLEGARGEQKIESANIYWKALECELFLYFTVQQERRHPQQTRGDEDWRGILCASQKRLPHFLHTVRDITLSLVPDHDRHSIVERFDVALLKEEFFHGICDFADFGKWLANTLKCHCAPVRDIMVDGMVAEIQQGASEGDVRGLVNGARRLLHILETMKLDITNHYIRRLHPSLIDNSIDFQREYISQRIADGRVDVAGARSWLESEITTTWDRRGKFHGLTALCSAVLKNTLSEQEREPFRSLFHMDVARLHDLRMSFRALLHDQICREIVMEAVSDRRSSREAVNACSAMRISVAAIVDAHGRLLDHVDNVAVQMMRFALIAEGSPKPFDAVLLDSMREQLVVKAQPESPSSTKHTSELLRRLTPKLEDCVAEHASLGTLQLHHALVLPRFGYNTGQAQSRSAPNSGSDDELIRRLAHIILIHWRVFGDLVYSG